MYIVYICVLCLHCVHCVHYLHCVHCLHCVILPCIIPVVIIWHVTLIRCCQSQSQVIIRSIDQLMQQMILNDPCFQIIAFNILLYCLTGILPYCCIVTLLLHRVSASTDDLYITQYTSHDTSYTATLGSWYTILRFDRWLCKVFTPHWRQSTSVWTLQPLKSWEA